MNTLKIMTLLMFNDEVEEAIQLYTSLFEDSEIIAMVKYGEERPGTPGLAQHFIFTLSGQVFMTIDANSGEELLMNPAMLLYVTVKDTMETERLFNGLKNEGVILVPETEMPSFRESTWAQDKFGVSFQLALPEDK